MSGWAEHVTAGLLGTQRRAVPELAGGAVGGEDAAARLLEQAAWLAVRRRAGRVPGKAEPIAPAPAETVPVVPRAAANRLDRILAGEQLRVLPEWLAAVAEAGFRAPSRVLPDLLEKGRGERAIRPYIAMTTGRRGLWLALQNPDWAYLATEDTPAEAAAGDVWETGTRGQRVAHLGRLRESDPAAAREALAGTWAKEPAADRAAFLGTFATGLSLADEEFLEDALDDRAKDVRTVAANLLATLPGAEYERRMAERARACLRPERRTVRMRTQMWIVVEPPAGHDAGMARDDIPFHAAGSFAPSATTGNPVGTRAGWLREIVARTPPETWTELFGGTPMEVVCLPIADDFARDVHLGWTRAAVRRQNAEWARALLKGGVVLDEVEALADLLAVLPEGEREEAAADLLRWTTGQVERLRVLARIPGPWTGGLASAVLTAMTSALKPTKGHDSGANGRFLAQLCRLADDRLSPGIAPLLADLAERHPESWPLTELSETLRFRHEMLQELGGPTDPTTDETGTEAGARTPRTAPRHHDDQ